MLASAIPPPPHPGPPPSIVVLPIAPQVVARTRFSPPTPLRGECLTVPEAMDLLDTTIASGTAVEMVELSGPGDPLATPETTLTLARLVSERYPHLPIGLRTLGYGAERLASELARAGITYVEMLVDAVHSEVVEKIYAWIRPGLKTLPIKAAAEQLIRAQRHGVSALTFRDIRVVVVTTLYPGINLHQVPRIAQAMRVLGADSLGLVPYLPEPGAEVALAACEEGSMAELATAKIVLPLTTPRLGRDPRLPSGPKTAGREGGRSKVAVASSRGRTVDLHLGQAESFLIFARDHDGRPRQIEQRPAPPAGGGDARWLRLATTLGDCFAVIAAAAGPTPRRLLAAQSIEVVIGDRPLLDMVSTLLAEAGQSQRSQTH